MRNRSGVKIQSVLFNIRGTSKRFFVSVPGESGLCIFKRRKNPSSKGGKTVRFSFDVGTCSKCGQQKNWKKIDWYIREGGFLLLRIWESPNEISKPPKKILKSPLVTWTTGWQHKFFFKKKEIPMRITTVPLSPPLKRYPPRKRGGKKHKIFVAKAGGCSSSSFSSP